MVIRVVAWIKNPPTRHKTHALISTQWRDMRCLSAHHNLQVRFDASCGQLAIIEPMEFSSPRRNPSRCKTCTMLWRLASFCPRNVSSSDPCPLACVFALKVAFCKWNMYVRPSSAEVPVFHFWLLLFEVQWLRVLTARGNGCVSPAYSCSFDWFFFWRNTHFLNAL